MSYCSCWQCIRSGPRDLEIHTLRICLRSIKILRSMKRDRLVAKDVFPRCNLRWNCDRPRVVVCDQRVRGPCAGCRRAIYESSFIDLGEQKGGLVNGGAITVARCEVVHDGAFVRGGPDGPLKLHSTTSCNCHICTARRRAHVTDDVRGTVVTDKAKVRVLWDRPARHCWWRVLILETGLVARIVDAISYYSLDNAVG